NAIGGIAQTYNYKGNRIDIGGHRFFSKSDRVMKWWFNILPLQGAPAADDLEKHHDIDYAAEAIVEYLCPECSDQKSEVSGQNKESTTGLTADRSPLTASLSVKKNAPDPEHEDEVM